MLKILTDYFLDDSHLSLPRIWLAVFIYASFIAILVQFVILVYVFPSWNNGQGLIKGMDQTYFHRIAVELSTDIRTYGWGAWKLRPGENGQSIAGIAAAIYAVTVQKPWILIPFNAALHATSAILLYFMLSFFVSNKKICLWGICPFVFYPSSALWYAQIHKDGVFICGVYTFAFGWLLLASNQIRKKGVLALLLGLIFINCGVFLVWVIRAYCVEILLALSTLIALILSIFYLLNILVFRVVSKNYLYLIIVFWAPVFLVNAMINANFLQPKSLKLENGFSDNHITTKLDVSVSQVNVTNHKNKDPSFITKELKEGAPSEIATKESKENGPSELITKESKESAPSDIVTKEPIPRKNLKNIYDHFIVKAQSNLNKIVMNRTGSAGSGGKSLIDSGVTFKNPLDIITYFPRLVQVSFLAPFPSMWFAKGNTPETTVMRMVSAFEMTVIYFSFLFLPIALWNFRKRIDFWMLLLLFGSMLLVFGFTIVNIGTFYRMRYGFIMPFVSFGVIGFAIFIHKTRK